MVDFLFDYFGAKLIGLNIAVLYEYIFFSRFIINKTLVLEVNFISNYSLYFILTILLKLKL